MSRTLHDLVLGELQQLTTKSQRDDRFDTYMKKTYNKTASLMANSCQAVAQMASTASNTGLALNKILGKNLPTGGPPLTQKSLTRFPLPRFLAYVHVSGGISVSSTLGDFRNISTIFIFLLAVPPYNFCNFDTKMV